MNTTITQLDEVLVGLLENGADKVFSFDMPRLQKFNESVRLGYVVSRDEGLQYVHFRLTAKGKKEAQNRLKLILEVQN